MGFDCSTGPLLALFLALAACPAAAATAAAQPETVALTYAWPGGLQVETRFTHGATRTPADKRPVGEMWGSHGFQSTRVDESVQSLPYLARKAR
jgi:hypothetical protein